MKAQILKLDKDLPTPSFKNPGDAGMDVHSKEDYSLKPGERKLIGTGFKIAVPHGYEVQMRPRSGLAIKNGITLVNTPGTIDAGYRGEVGVILINHGQDVFEIKRGDRIAQMVFNRIETPEIEEVEELSDSIRGEGGFGSTGKR